MEAFIGTGVALITPFKEDLSVDTNALAALVKDQIANGIDYLVVLGTTAETATLKKDEKELVKTIVKEANAGKLPLVLGIGGNDTAGVVEELMTTSTDGFDAILSVSPYYNKPTQEGIYRHFKAVAEAAPLPVIIYNVPGRTASNILPETVNRIARDFKNVIGVKEAAGDIVQAMRLISMVPEGFMVISGDDMITLPMVLAGGKGVISVIGQGLPKAFSEMVRLGLSGDVAGAYKLHYKIAPSIDLIFAEGNPAGIKALLSKKGLITNSLRLPLVEATDTLRNKIEAFVDSF